MSEIKHTLGPWWPVQSSTGSWYVTTYRDHESATAKPNPFGASIAPCIGDHTEKRTRGNEEANARLIAAAPELLEALAPFAAVAEHDIGDDEADAELFQLMGKYNRAPKLTVSDFRRALAIIAKAKGTA
jgi:hypothetical protein